VREEKKIIFLRNVIQIKKKDCMYSVLPKYFFSIYSISPADSQLPEKNKSVVRAPHSRRGSNQPVRWAGRLRA
jgi:hypothetical protein